MIWTWFLKKHEIRDLDSLNGEPGLPASTVKNMPL